MTIGKTENGKSILGRLIGGGLTGGIGGWLIGMVWYFLVEVPYAKSHLDFMHRDGYLCAAGNALSLLAIPGMFFGAIAGLFVGMKAGAVWKRELSGER